MDQQEKLEKIRNDFVKPHERIRESCTSITQLLAKCEVLMAKDLEGFDIEELVDLLELIEMDTEILTSQVTTLLSNSLQTWHNPFPEG